MRSSRPSALPPLADARSRDRPRRLAAAPAGAADAERPTVIELFQSQGCSSCPPANAALIEFAARDDVLALNFAVDYWDRLGWKDTFAKPEFTAEAMGLRPRAWGRRTSIRLQIVVNGRAAGVGAEAERNARTGRAQPTAARPAPS